MDRSGAGLRRKRVADFPASDSAKSAPRDYGGVSTDSSRILEHHRPGNRISRQYRQTAAVGIPFPDAGRGERDFLCSVLHLCAAGIACFWNGEKCVSGVGRLMPSIKFFHDINNMFYNFII